MKCVTVHNIFSIAEFLILFIKSTGVKWVGCNLSFWSERERYSWYAVNVLLKQPLHQYQTEVFTAGNSGWGSVFGMPCGQVNQSNLPLPLYVTSKYARHILVRILQSQN